MGSPRLNMGEEAAPAESPPAEPPKEGEAPENAGEEQEEVEEELNPIIDLSGYFIKPDHFDGIHVLDEGLEKVDGAPNFRNIPGFPVYGVGQPSETGMEEIIKKIKKDDNEKIIWINLRREPIVYINGYPFAARNPDNLHENIQVTPNDEEATVLGKHLARVVNNRSKETEDKSIKIHCDKEYNDNPMDRVDVEESIVVQEVKDLDSIYKKCIENCGVDLQVSRIPMIEDQMPAEQCFDAIVDILKNEPASTPVIFSCQMGKGRTSLGITIALLVKEMQLTAQLKQMNELDLIKSDTLKDLLFKKFEEAPPQGEDVDPLSSGEFEVIKQLVAAIPEAAGAKEKIDKIIDKCGNPPRGVGIQNLRTCIAETKWKFDVSPEERQGAFKVMIINFIERYFYLICFCMYSQEHGPGGFQKQFSAFMEEKKELRQMATDGKDKLEWSRTVDAEKLEQLKEMMASPDYKENISKLIQTIYHFAFSTYADLPRGPIKKNSMRKLTFTTLMEILPPELSDKINKKISETPEMRPDFLSIIGMVSYL